MAATVTEDAKLTASDAEPFSYFGFSVAVDGDTAVVGSPLATIGTTSFQGAAYVYVRAGSSWVQQAKLTAGDGTAGDQFGTDVAVSGDTIVVGAHQKDVGANSAQGAAYVFRREGNLWQQEAELIAADGGNTDFFGYSVALSADTIVVGAGSANVGPNLYQGAAYVYQRSGQSWNVQAKLTASDGDQNDMFGDAVAISGDRVAIGAPNRNVRRGAVYVFVRNGISWFQQATLIAADGLEYQYLGTSVAVSGDTILAGAPYGNITGDVTNGAAYIFNFNIGGGFWQLQTKLFENSAYTSNFGDYFGGSVALSGGVAVVGAQFNPVNGMIDHGSAYVYANNGGSWALQSQLQSSDGVASDYFGGGVAVIGTTVLAGAVNAGATQALGAAYVFDVTPPLPTLQIDNAAVVEGNKKFNRARFTISMSRPSTVPVTVLVTTADIDARSGEDFVGGSTTVTFKPGQTRLPFKVRVIGDKVVEADEQFTVTLSNPTGAVIAAGQGTGIGIILNDD